MNANINYANMTTTQLIDYIAAHYDYIAAGKVQSVAGYTAKLIEPAITVLARKCHFLGKPVPRLGTTTELFDGEELYINVCAVCEEDLDRRDNRVFNTEDGKRICVSCHNSRMSWLSGCPDEA